MVIPTRFVDNVTRFRFDGAAVRGAVVSLDDACREILDQHPYPPALRRALAELLAAAALLASPLRFKGTLIVELQGTGPVSLLVVECTADLGLRATAQWRDAAAVFSRPYCACIAPSANSRPVPTAQKRVYSKTSRIE